MYPLELVENPVSTSEHSAASYSVAIKGERLY